MYKLASYFFIALLLSTSCTPEIKPPQQRIATAAFHVGGESCKEAQKKYLIHKFGDSAFDLNAAALLHLILDNKQDFFQNLPRCYENYLEYQ